MAIPDNEAASLARDFLGAIGTEALAETGGDRFRSGQPLAGDPNFPENDAPAPETPPPAEESTAPAQPPPAEPEKLIAGKYRTVDDAERAIMESSKFVDELQTRARTAEERIAQLQQALNPAPPAPPDPLAELEIYGVPKEQLARAVNSLTKNAVQEMFAPALHRAEADKRIIAIYPEYQPNFDKLTAFVESQPELLAKVNRAEGAGEFLLARELAWLNYERAGLVAKTAELNGQHAARVDQAKERMADAAVTKPSQTEERTRPRAASPNEMPDEQFDRLKDLNKAGYGRQLWQQTIGSVLARDYPDVFGPDSKY